MPQRKFSPIARAFFPLAKGVLQRKCACGGTPGPKGECESCRKKLQRRSENFNPSSILHPPSSLSEAPPIVHEVLRSAGRPLDDSTRALMEPRFGHDFSNVRVHTDARAAESAQQVNARAYTVGADVVFGAGRYAPSTPGGQRLLAHELIHVLQQGADAGGGRPQLDDANSQAEREAEIGSRKVMSNSPKTLRTASPGRATGQLQRELATPGPAKATPAQSELTETQIKTALAFNRTRYTQDQTKLIQDIIGTESTGVWTEADVQTVAEIQQTYGLKKDGIVGSEMFKFLDQELRLESIPMDDANCLTSFFALGFPATFQPASPGRHTLQGHFKVQAQFPQRCNCADFEYRQFVRGHFVRRRGGVETDLRNAFRFVPGGSLTPDFIEDGNTSSSVVYYGHRADPPDPDIENHYINDKGADDQANGCRYRNEDMPGWLTIPTSPGDEFEGAIQFRGEIQRNGRTLRTLHWNALQGTFRT